MALMPFYDVSMSQSILEQILFFCGFFFFLLDLGLYSLSS